MRSDLQRDEGLARLSRATRWLAAGAVISAGCASIAVAETLPGRSSAATPPARPATSASSVPASSVPASSVPASSVPATSVPASSVPASSVPATSDTAPPATALPATAAPQTLSPPTAPPQTTYNPPVVSSGGS